MGGQYSADPTTPNLAELSHTFEVVKSHPLRQTCQSCWPTGWRGTTGTASSFSTCPRPLGTAEAPHLKGMLRAPGAWFPRSQLTERRPHPGLGPLYPLLSVPSPVPTGRVLPPCCTGPLLWVGVSVGKEGDQQSPLTTPTALAQPVASVPMLRKTSPNPAPPHTSACLWDLGSERSERVHLKQKLLFICTAMKISYVLNKLLRKASCLLAPGTL